MILTLLTKQELSLKNKRTLKYDLMTAEKDYFLAVVSKEAKQKERSVVYYQDAIFAHDEQIQQAVEALSFEPIPINSVFQK